MTKTTGNFTDFVSFSRASGGTALRKISYGSELVTNGTFDTDTSGWTVAANATVAVVSSEAEVTTTLTSGISQTITTVAGKVYQVTGTIRNSTATDVRLRAVDGSGFISPIIGESAAVSSTSGTAVSTAFVALSTQTTIYARVNGAGIGFFDNISVKEVLFDRADGTLQLFNHPTNVPRVEYDASGNLKGLLIEEARTNLFTNSNQYSAGGPGAGSISLTTAATGPVGSSTYVNIGTVNSAYVAMSNTVSISGSITTMTIFVKKGLYSRYLALRMQGTYPSRLDVTYDLDSGVVSATSGNTYTHVASSIIPIGDGWFRVSATVNPIGSNLSTCYLSFVENSAGQIDQTQTAFPRDGYIAGAQLEVGAFPTSYIPTPGPTATRAADICSIATSAFGYNQGAGTIVVDVAEFKFGTSGYPRAVELGNSSNGGERINIYVDSALQNYRTSLNTANALQANILLASGVVSPLAPSKSAMTYKTNDVSAAYGGSVVGADTLADITGTSYPRNTLKIGGSTTAVTDQINGHIKSIRYFPRRLTNAQIQALTA